MFTVSSTLTVLTGQTDWVSHIGTLTPCIEEVATSCVIVTWWSGAGGTQPDLDDQLVSFSTLTLLESSPK